MLADVAFGQQNVELCRSRGMSLNSADHEHCMTKLKQSYVAARCCVALFLIFCCLFLGVRDFSFGPCAHWYFEHTYVSSQLPSLMVPDCA